MRFRHLIMQGRVKIMDKREKRLNGAVAEHYGRRERLMRKPARLLRWYFFVRGLARPFFDTRLLSDPRHGAAMLISHIYHHTSL